MNILDFPSRAVKLPPDALWADAYRAGTVIAELAVNSDTQQDVIDALAVQQFESGASLLLDRVQACEGDMGSLLLAAYSGAFGEAEADAVALAISEVAGWRADRTVKNEFPNWSRA